VKSCIFSHEFGWSLLMGASVPRHPETFTLPVGLYSARLTDGVPCRVPLQQKVEKHCCSGCSISQEWERPGWNGQTGIEQKRLPVPSSWSRLRSYIRHGKLMMIGQDTLLKSHNVHCRYLVGVSHILEEICHIHMICMHRHEGAKQYICCDCRKHFCKVKEL